MKDFCGFRFGNIHSEDLHLIVVSSSSRYDKNLLPESKDYTMKIEGSDGELYYGRTFDKRTFSVKVAFDEVSESDFRRIALVFATDKLQDLVFDELPYKTYKAKLKQRPDFKFVCFENKFNDRVYKGEGTLEFICYYPFAFCFNKYIVRAADHYKHLTIEDTDLFKLYDEYDKEENKFLEEYLKLHYNVDNNMGFVWKGGYPTTSLALNGELYFNLDTDDVPKQIIDTRKYIDNIDRWQTTAKLLTSPTLDYEQELMYLPQYSRLSYYNMDIGVNNKNSIIGSRVLVYNPGDIPIDFKLEIRNIFPKLRNIIDKYSFRISRYNVLRLTLELAVDWTGLETFNPSDNKNFKYDNKYFYYLQKKDDNNIEIKELSKRAHPKHAYIVEPIPKEHLSDFIKTFYIQSGRLEAAQGEKLAERYLEMYDLCITETEKNRLYWDTLKNIIFSQFYNANEQGYLLFLDGLDFLKTYIYNPREYIKLENLTDSYNNFNFNYRSFPSYYTYDYLDVTNDFFIYPFKEEDKLILDSEKRLLYKENDIADNNIIKEKIILNEYIERGQWFKLPPGWSMIDISPILNEDFVYGKTWNDARPFEWGTNDKSEYDSVFNQAKKEYIRLYCPNNFLKLFYDNNEDKIKDEIKDRIDNKDNFISKLRTAGLEECLKDDIDLEAAYDELLLFRKWYYDEYLNPYKFFLDFLCYQSEYNFLKFLSEFWRCKTKGEKGVQDWWFYANSYLWANFPPVYWGYADLLNLVKISYIPKFY